MENAKASNVGSEQILEEACPKCKSQVNSNFNFCPNCGLKLKEPIPDIAKQIGIYLLSFLLPPLGFFPGIRYLRSPDQKTKTVGIIAIILTIISTVVTLWLTISLVGNINKSINTQLNDLQNIRSLGY